MATKVKLKKIAKLTNEAYHDYFINDSRYLIMYGGAGSGKSVFAAQSHLVRILNEPNHRILVVRKVARTLRHSVFALFRDLIAEWGLTKLFKVNKSDMEITCVNGNQILFAGLDDVEKLKSITGITSIWIEEASEIAESDFNQLDLRLRGKSKNYKQITLTFNPISALSWLKSHFFDVSRPNVTKLKTTYKDNRFIDKEYKEMIEELKNKDHVLYQIYALGEWGLLGNLIYTNWTVEEISTDDEWYGSTYQGLDFGFNNPSAYIKVGMHDDELYVYDEFYRKGLTNTELIKELTGQADKWQLITADSAEPDRIKEFKNAGFKIVGAKKEKGSVETGIDYIKHRKLHIHPRCVNMIKELQSYKYKEDKDGRVYDQPVDMYNHLLDGLRYALDQLRQHPQTYTGSLSANDSLQRVSPNRV